MASLTVQIPSDRRKRKPSITTNDDDADDGGDTTPIFTEMEERERAKFLKFERDERVRQRKEDEEEFRLWTQNSRSTSVFRPQHGSMMRPALLPIRQSLDQQKATSPTSPSSSSSSSYAKSTSCQLLWLHLSAERSAVAAAAKSGRPATPRPTALKSTTDKVQRPRQELFSSSSESHPALIFEEDVEPELAGIMSEEASSRSSGSGSCRRSRGRSGREPASLPCSLLH